MPYLEPGFPLLPEFDLHRTKLPPLIGGQRGPFLEQLEDTLLHAPYEAEAFSLVGYNRLVTPVLGV